MNISTLSMISLSLLVTLGCESSSRKSKRPPVCAQPESKCVTVPSPTPAPTGSPVLDLTPASEDELTAWLKSKGLDHDTASLKSRSDWNMDLRNLTDADVRYILSLPELRKLSVRANDLTRIGINALIEAERIVELDISCQQKPLRQLPHPRKAGQLQKLTAERIGLDHYIDTVVPAFPALKHLNIGNSWTTWKLSHRDDRHNYIHDLRISPETSLTSLNLDQVDANDATLLALQNQVQLEDLNLANNHQITDHGIAAVAQLPALKALRLDFELGSWSSDSRVLTDASVESLTKAPQLEFLSLRSRLGFTKLQLTEKSISLLAQMTRLRYLDISHINSRDSDTTPRYFGETHPDLAALASLTQLEELYLAGSILTQDKLLDANFLESMPGLRKLRLSGFEISPATVQAVAQLQNLEELDFSSNRSNSLDLTPFHKLPKLRHLSIGYSVHLLSKPLQDLISNTRLESLDLAPAEGIFASNQSHELASTTLKKVKIYSLNSTTSQLLWVASLAKLPQLEELEIGDYYSQINFTQDHLNLLQDATSLRKLTITGTSSAQDWSVLRNLTALELLRLEGSSEANIWSTLPILPKLNVLDIPNDAAMNEYLAQYPRNHFLAVGTDAFQLVLVATPNIVFVR